MNILPDRCHATRGSALFTVLIIMGVLSLVTTSMVYMALQQPFNVRRTRDQIRAQDVAEAGANIAFAMLSTNFSLKDNAGAFPLTPYRGGTYDVTVNSFSPTTAVISSVGVVNSTMATVALDILCTVSNLPSGQPAATGAFANAVTSGGAMTWNGSGPITISGGKIHSNSQIKMTGSSVVNANISSVVKFWTTGSVAINGNVTAPVYAGQSPGNINGTATTAAVPLVTIPSIDLTPYYNAALANGQVYTSTYTVTGSADLAPAGGILWVTGDFNFSGSGNIIGAVIATGNISISGSGNQIKVGNYPALASQNGSIDISGSGSLHGLIYAPTGNFSKSGSGAIVGSIIASGTFDKSGSWSLMTFENSTPVPPGGGGSGSSQTGASISGWRQ
jgi:cytoskeletal protein CcmA (bactofilin family)